MHRANDGEGLCGFGYVFSTTVATPLQAKRPNLFACVFAKLASRWLVNVRRKAVQCKHGFHGISNPKSTHTHTLVLID